MRFYTLQLLRFIAAVLVMFHHLQGFSLSGNRGVYIFFVLSGFVIYRALFDGSKPNANRFFIDRFTKIFFLYWLALALMLAAKHFPLTPALLGTIFLIPNHLPVLLVSWSLTYELYFYVFTGAAAYLLKEKYARLFLFAYLMVCTIVAFLFLSGQLDIKGSLINFLLGKNTWNFLLGLLTGYLSTILFRSSIKIRFIVPACFLAYVLCSAFFIQPSDEPLPVLITGIVAMGLVLFSAAYEKDNALPAKTAAVFGILGDASYAIYLLAPVMGIFIKGRTYSDKMIIIFGTIAAAILLHQLIEKKALVRIRKALYKKFA